MGCRPGELVRHLPLCGLRQEFWQRLFFFPPLSSWLFLLPTGPAAGGGKLLPGSAARSSHSYAAAKC